MSSVKIPRETIYNLKIEHISDIGNIIQNLPLILYLNEDYSKFIHIISETSSPYIMFSYGSTISNRGPYKCIGVSHANSKNDSDFCNLENGSYFDDNTFQRLVDRTIKCIINKVYANNSVIKLYENQFDKEDGNIEWSVIVNKLNEKGLIKSKMSERDNMDVFDGRKIREINGKEVFINVDTLYDLGDKESDGGNMLLDLYKEIMVDNDNKNYCVIS